MTSDELALYGLIATVVFGALAYVQTRRANRLAEAIANAGRATELPSVHLGWPFGDSDCLYILAAPIQAGRVLEVPITYLLANRGARTAKEIEVHIRVPSLLYLPKAPALPVSVESESKRVEGQVTSMQPGHRTFSFNVTSLDPGQQVSVRLSWYVSGETLLIHPVPVTTKDGREIVLDVLAALTYLVQVSMTYEDHTAWAVTYEVMVINTAQRTIAEALEPLNHQLMVEHRDRLAKQSWWRRATFKSVHRSIRVLVPDTSKILSDPVAPLDRASGEFTVAEGKHLPFGYWIPALGVHIDGTKSGP
jgi:hypothetical protein